MEERNSSRDHEPSITGGPLQARPSDSQSKITQAEMAEMFGSEMPIEAVDLLWSAHGDMTIGQLRAKLREIAAQRPSPPTR